MWVCIYKKKIVWWFNLSVPSFRLPSQQHDSVSHCQGRGSPISSEERRRLDRKHLDDITAARLLPLHHMPTQLLSIEESLALQKQQKQSYEVFRVLFIFMLDAASISQSLLQVVQGKWDLVEGSGASLGQLMPLVARCALQLAALRLLELQRIAGDDHSYLHHQSAICQEAWEDCCKISHLWKPRPSGSSSMASRSSTLKNSSKNLSVVQFSPEPHWENQGSVIARLLSPAVQGEHKIAGEIVCIANTQVDTALKKPICGPLWQEKNLLLVTSFWIALCSKICVFCIEL